MHLEYVLGPAAGLHVEVDIVVALQLLALRDLRAEGIVLGGEREGGRLLYKQSQFAMSLLKNENAHQGNADTHRELWAPSWGFSSLRSSSSAEAAAQAVAVSAWGIGGWPSAVSIVDV